MRYSDNVIEQTWMAYAVDPRSVDDIDRRLARVGDHYAALLADPVDANLAGNGRVGLALWAREDPRLRWPLWLREGRLTGATPAVPTGWRRVIGAGREQPAAELLRALAETPERAAELNPPVVVGVLDEQAGRLSIANDVVGCGRLYEMSFPGGHVWSNRLAALPLFAGVDAQPDERAWAVFAAAGWFLGEMTPIAGATKVPPGSVLRIDEQGINRRETDPRRELVQPRQRTRDAVDDAAGQVLELAEDMAAAWSVPIAVSLTGGRDSRVSAAGIVAAGVEATFNTGDQVPGEVDVVRELVARSPTAMDHTVHRPEPESSDDAVDLRERLRRIHLVHDGMRNPQEVRRPSEVPQVHVPPPTLSGHGGELGHGFYYTTKEKLRRLKRGRDRALIAQLERNARRRHSAAGEQAYELYLDECRRTLDLGREFCVKGPSLLDWFYMAQRLPYRSGIGARSGRSSACVVPAFMRSAFDLKPKERLDAKLHREVVARLVPEWRDVDFFRAGESDGLPDIHRARIWERPQEAQTVAEIVAEAGGWTEMFEPTRIREMWAEVGRGEGSADYEHVFYRVLWRAGYDAHLANLRDRVRA